MRELEREPGLPGVQELQSTQDTRAWGHQGEPCVCTCVLVCMYTTRAYEDAWNIILNRSQAHSGVGEGLPEVEVWRSDFGGTSDVTHSQL